MGNGWTATDRYDDAHPVPRRFPFAYKKKRYAKVIADAGYERKAECMRARSKLPLEERTKCLEVAKTFHEERAASKARLTSEEGIQLRVNRSIQAKGVFANIKADMGFRRFLSRCNANVLVETMLLAMAHNFGKLHQKIQRGYGKQYFFPVEVAA